MEKCVYCGKNLALENIFAKAHTREFGVCSNNCKSKTEDYVQKDKKYKLSMFLLILLGGLGFMASILFGNGENNMMLAYLGQILAGIAFLLFPYPIVSFETFFTTPIKKIIVISKVVGIFFIVWGIVLLLI